MLLADTSVWIAHFRYEDSGLASYLEQGLVLMHPLILGELACGNLKNRARTIAHFRDLPRTVIATDDEVLTLIDKQRLWGRGLGWIDMHLLASALISSCAFWSMDRRLRETARELGIIDHL